MAKRSYRQYCGLARALDLVGDRWTLLIIRELLIGPRRFKDLADGLMGIGTNLLSARLRDLEGLGLATRIVLSSPERRLAYELTERGRELEPVVAALARWGFKSLGHFQQTDTYRPGWAMLAMKYAFRPEAARGVHETYEFHLDDQPFHVRVRKSAVEAGLGAAENPDLVITADTRSFLAVATGQMDPQRALRTGALRVQGRPASLKRCMAMFTLLEEPAGPAPSARGASRPAHRPPLRRSYRTPAR